MHRSQRDQCLARAAFCDHHGGSRLLPAFSDPHNGDGLCREGRSQKSFNPRGYSIVELVQRWILLENALSQKRRVTTHVVVDRGQFWHGNLWYGERFAGGNERTKEKKEKKKMDGAEG
jgi:hypothetical protein